MRGGIDLFNELLDALSAKGVASSLLAAGEQRLRALGAVRLQAIVDDQTPAAVDF